MNATTPAFTWLPSPTCGGVMAALGLDSSAYRRHRARQRRDATAQLDALEAKLYPDAHRPDATRGRTPAGPAYVAYLRGLGWSDADIRARHYPAPAWLAAYVAPARRTQSEASPW
ncbi:hypothetical protein RN607_03545 [Demequina capsici]|uniref:Uncharacterized protein n=1 Tax=Demequina capsici TaxID=3075620 RepID=A0AA96FD01_9MICO|nr:hypothetical protein [Demequina sp. PMTSA13]WNM28089.1 hypothetical protein RN607_03545 [Demequina sp. PMTSA13]